MSEDSTWKEMERSLKKDGFREGALKGSEISFQTGFDEGFAEGMKKGKLYGEHNGAKIAGKCENEVIDVDRGNCSICLKTPK